MKTEGRLLLNGLGWEGWGWCDILCEQVDLFPLEREQEEQEMDYLNALVVLFQFIYARILIMPSSSWLSRGEICSQNKLTTHIFLIYALCHWGELRGIQYIAKNINNDTEDLFECHTCELSDGKSLLLTREINITFYFIASIIYCIYIFIGKFIK